MKYGFAIHIEDIDENRVIKANVILEVESESSWRLPVFLAMVAELGKMLQSILIDFLASTCENAV
jgi:hypothetical protein